MRSDRNTIAADLGCTVNSANIKRKFIVCNGSGRASDSRLREPRFESCAACQTLGKFFHPTLFQFTQLYEYLAIDSGG